MVQKKLISLQVLRALAAFLVLFTHIFNTAQGRVSSFHFQYSNDFGAIGVDVFFVLSGVVMTLILADGREKSAFDFFIKRCRRIIPIYWLVSFAAAAVWYICRHSMLPSFSFVRTITIMPLVESKRFGTALLTVGWTLSFEFFFYIICSISIWLRPAHPSRVLFIIISFLSVIGIIFKFSDSRLIFITNPIMIEFLYGCICAWIYLSRFKIPPVLSIAFVAISLIYFFSGVFTNFDNAIAHEGNTQNATSSLLRAFEWGLPAFVLVFSFLMAEKSGVFKTPAFLVTMGDASYALYLLHVPIITIIQTLFSSAHIFLPNVYFITCFSVCLIAAYYVHIYVELPMLDFFAKKQYSKALIGRLNFARR